MLVVVLIIGIIAAIALPQYQLAVLKSRYTQLMLLADALHSAQDAYYLVNGKYSLKINDLDITIPGDCNLSDSGGLISCPKFACTVYDGADNTDINGNVYCTMRMDGNKTIYYRIFPLRRNTKRLCGTLPTNEWGKKLCENLGGRYSYSSNGVEYYKL